MPSFLFVAPFSIDSTFITCDLNLDMRFVLNLNYKHVRTAGFTVFESLRRSSLEGGGKPCYCTCLGMSYFIYTVQRTGHSTEAEFLDITWTIAFKSFPPCYSQSPLLTDYTSPSLEQKCFETDLWWKPQVWEHSRSCPKTSMKLYVHEFGFWSQKRTLLFVFFAVGQSSPVTGRQKSSF